MTERVLPREQQRRQNKHYFDACTLTNFRCQQEIANSRERYGFYAITSALAIGEAVFNIINKSKPKEAATSAKIFVDFIAEQAKNRNLELVSSEDVGEQLNTITEIVSELDVADAYHIAISVKHQCKQIITGDRDLYGIQKRKINELKEELHLDDEFTIVKRTEND